MRLIEEGAFWDNLNDEIEMGITDIAEAVSNALDNTPSIEAEPVVHAHWDFIQECSDGSEEYRCSNCKHYLVLYHMASPYCPHCGAKMDEK